MIGFIKSLFSKSFRYERDREIAQDGTEKQRLTLAKSTQTHKEILYYLAEKDPSIKVRQAVAKNRATPVQAVQKLAMDTSEDVRLTLAARLVELLPELSKDKQSQLYAFAVQALGTLALDEVLKIRRALASSLKDHAHVPPAVAGQLARDLEREVAEPILRFCIALADSDLIDILSQHPADWAIEAIAGRPKVSGPVSKAVIGTGNVKAGEILLRNQGATITKELLQEIIERAKEFPEWHEPIACRKNLPPEMAKALMRYVDGRVRKLLREREYDLQTTENVIDSVRRRIAFEEEFSDESEETEEQSSEPPAERAKRFAAEGRLDDETVGDALGMRDREFVIAALALKARTTEKNVQKILSLNAPKPVCALTWKAGLSMRTALRIQQEIAGVPHKELIYPKDGTDYPLSEKDLKWQAEFLGI